MKKQAQLSWTTEQRKVSELIPYEFNPRQLTEKQKEDLQSSLQKFNLVEIPAINLDNKILAGHQRVNMLYLLGRGTDVIDVRVPNRKLTNEEFQEYNIRSNKNTGSWDFDILANSFEIPDLLSWGFDEKEFGMGTDEEEIKSDPFEDEGKAIENKFGVIVECPDTFTQEEVYNELTAKGYKCKVVVV